MLVAAPAASVSPPLGAVTVSVFGVTAVTLMSSNAMPSLVIG